MTLQSLDKAVKLDRGDIVNTLESHGTKGIGGEQCTELDANHLHGHA